MFILTLSSLIVLSTCSLVQRSFHKVSGSTSAMLPLNASTRTPTVAMCALQCGQLNALCESFIYNHVTLHCVLGGRLLTAGIRPSPGLILYTSGKLHCDSHLGYFLTYFGDSELCARVVWTAVTYSAAASDCIGHHGRLLTVKTAERHDLLLELLRSYNTSTLHDWVGLNDISVEGQFVWSDGTPMTPYQRVLFRNNQPDDAYVGEDCCQYIFANTGNGLNDADCGLSFGYICEYVL